MIRTVSDAWLREQTTTPSTDGFYRLMVGHLNRKPSSKALIINGEKRWNEDAVRALMSKPPRSWQWK